MSTLLQLLRAQASAALSDDAKIQREVRDARELLNRVSDASVQALKKLDETDQELKQKWSALAALLTDVKRLETERAAALEMARQFRAAWARHEPDDDEGASPGDHSEDSKAMPPPMPSAQRVSPWRVSSNG